MIFGDREQFALEVVRFEPPWPGVSPDEPSAWGALTVWVAGVNIAEHRRHGTDRVRDSIHVPLLSLARWCTAARAPLRFEERSQLGSLRSPHDELDRWSRSPAPATYDEDGWLDRRDAWWTRHFSGSATQDLVAPSLGLVRNDDRVLVSWRVPTLPRPDRTFLSPLGNATVSFQSVAAALDEFAASVEGWTSGAVSGATPLEGRSALEYYTGLASDELTAFHFRPGASEDPAGDPLAQVVRDLTHQTATGAARQAIVDFVRTPRRSGGEAWWTLRRTLVSTRQIEVEAEGYAAAAAVRDRLGLDGQPLGDVEHLARGLDVHVDAASPAVAMDRMAVVGEAGRPASIMVLANARTATPWGRRFEIVRGLGHLLLDPPREDVIGAASGPLAMATRRRRSGAFAAELLLPHQALLDASDGALDGIVQDARFGDLLTRFGVGATTAAFQLWNGGLLSSPEIRDDLIASV